MIDKRVSRRTVSKTTVRFSRKEIVDALDLYCSATEQDLDIPESAEVRVRVPGGGDWSNTDLEIDSDCPLTVSWKETHDS